MTFLFLPRLKTIDVAEESRRFKDIVFLHLLYAKLLILFELYNFHLSLVLHDGLYEMIRSYRHALTCSFDQPNDFRLVCGEHHESIRATPSSSTSGYRTPNGPGHNPGLA